ncbi:MAG TPA: (Fe-S)-binding protein, partial [Firmicutes bacterium]|nr:(Fe-S)-binding protein [Bacillota bacterium]
MAKQLKDFAKEIQDCLQCGFCLAKCPIYRELRMDPMVARGEINLAKALLEGDIEATKKMDEMLMMCQLCGQCTEACPAG